MPLIPALQTIAGEVRAAPHNSNYTSLFNTLNTWAVFKDVPATIEASHTFTALQTFSAGLKVTAGGVEIEAGGLLIEADGADITGNVSITGDLDVSGVISGALAVTLSAANITAGTFPGSAYTFAGTVTTTGTMTVQNQVHAFAGVFSNYSTANVSGSITLNVATFDGLRRRLTGNTTITFTSQAGIGNSKRFALATTQDGTGGWTLSFVGVTWEGGVMPTPTATAGRTDWWEFWDSPMGIMGRRIGENYAVS